MNRKNAKKTIVTVLAAALTAGMLSISALAATPTVGWCTAYHDHSCHATCTIQHNHAYGGCCTLYHNHAYCVCHAPNTTWNTAGSGWNSWTGCYGSTWGHHSSSHHGHH